MGGNESIPAFFFCIGDKIMASRRKNKKKYIKEIKNNTMISLRLPKDDLEIWKDTSEKLGISLSEYIRQNVNKGRISYTIKNEVSFSQIKNLLAQYGKIGSNINQIAHHLNAGMGWSKPVLIALRNALGDLNSLNNEVMDFVRRFNGYT